MTENPQNHSPETPKETPNQPGAEGTDNRHSDDRSSNRPPETGRDTNRPGERQEQKQPAPASPMSVLLILAITLLIVFFFSSVFNKYYTIPLSVFLQLVELGPDSDKAITVEEGPEKAKLTVQYSKLENIRVNGFVVSGTVTRSVIAPEKYKSKEPQKEAKFYSGRQGFVYDNGDLLRRLEEKKFKFESEGYPSILKDFAPSLLLLIISIPLVFLLFRYMMGGGAMAFSRSRGKLVAQEEINITFNDVAGVDEAVEELKETVAFLRTPEKFQALGGRIPRGVLLVGPPGTGKTILAKAVAGEAGVPFFTLSGSDFVELYVGVGAARVRDLFEQAQRRGRSIIFIDELDAIGKIRSGHVGGGSSEEREQTLNALLVEMDGFNSNSMVIVIAATNRPEILDPALLRPGRFDRQVLVDRPDLRGREAILKVHIKDVKLDPEVDLKEVASISAGFVGADLAALVNEAALLAARIGKDSVTMEEFNEGVERLTAGLQKKKRVMKQEEKKRVAYHESGHALVAYFTPGADTVHKVSIIPRGLAALGYMLQRPEDDRYLMSQKELEARIMIMLGGTIAEELVFEDFSTGASNDLERATEVARSMVMDYGMSALGRINFRENRSTLLGDSYYSSRNHSEQTAWEIDKEIKAILQRLFDKTKKLLEEKYEALVRLSESLLEKEVVETEELARILDGGIADQPTLDADPSNPHPPGEETSSDSEKDIFPIEESSETPDLPDRDQPPS